MYEGLKINISRLLNRLDAFSQIGRNEQGGIDRTLGDESERKARNRIVQIWNSMGLTTWTDGIANLWAKRSGRMSLPPIAMGSHHDAVPNGGAFDGVLGVLTATEIMQTLIETGVETRHPLYLVSFTAEEPNPFNVSTLGSKVASGRLVQKDLQVLRNRDTGEDLQSVLKTIGGDLEQVNHASIRSGDLSAFLECHNELGRRLYDGGLPVGSVTEIVGIYRENVTIQGEANHAGTTVMRDRKDALLAAGEWMLGYETIVKAELSDEVVGTVGYLTLSPNEANIIPGEVRLVLELRCCDPNVKRRVQYKLDELQKRIQSTRKVTISRIINLDQPAMPLDKTVREAIEEGIRSVGVKPMRLVSMAGHDAANMQRVTRSGMIFAESIDGKGHCPQEKTSRQSIELTANAMLRALLVLDGKLDSDA